MSRPTPPAGTRPNAFIVGQPKSGTSALYSFLKAHPDVATGETKEPQYFCRDLASQYFHLRKLERTDENYLSLFERDSATPIVLEASTAYLYSMVAAAEIQRFNPQAKAIAMLREPVSFLLSYHLQLQRTSVRFESERSFARALELEPERRANMNIPHGCLEPAYLYYSERVQYSAQLKRFLDVFGQSRLKVIIYDDFREDNSSVYREVLQFLHLDPNFEPEFRTVNARARVRLPGVKRFLDRTLFSTKHFLKRRIDPGFYGAARSLYRSAFLAPTEEPVIDPELTLELRLRFRPEVEELSTLLGRDLVELWGYDSVGARPF